MKLHVIYSENSIEDLSKDEYQLTLTYDEWTKLQEILTASIYNLSDRKKVAEDFERSLSEANIKRTSEWI